MKKKLLITMGCSFTEGIGCWDTSVLPRNFSPSHGKYQYYSYHQANRFHELGWPNKLGKRMGYDMVVNLGLAGSSSSGQVKQFFEKYLDKDFSDWDVTVVWLLTHPSRISFYKNDKIKNLLAQNELDRDDSVFDGYIEFLSDSKNFDKDLINEQFFYRKIMKTICDLKSYSFLSFHIHSIDYKNIISNIIGKDTSHCHALLDNFIDKSKTDDYISTICGHPTELGYDLIATNMFNWIRHNHSYLISEPSNSIEWKWDGNCINFEKK